MGEDVGLTQRLVNGCWLKRSRQKLAEGGYKGGLLDGLVDVDEEANACERLRKGKQQKALGTHILQLLFIGLTGFSFRLPTL
ncbi:hypothetical protein MAR_038274 [Mya arenaria]|uniref:Uncharacterized protein n=1 Tax=Mya arenaria TaxID=6604 RepID=A0ABY7FQW5_MYAAR|nr:hypothetical protein MAR_038274 [Mya arenaria]